MAPRISKIVRITYGNNAVKYTIWKKCGKSCEVHYLKNITNTIMNDIYVCHCFPGSFIYKLFLILTFISYLEINFMKEYEELLLKLPIVLMYSILYLIVLSWIPFLSSEFLYKHINKQRSTQTVNTMPAPTLLALVCRCHLISELLYVCNILKIDNHRRNFIQTYKLMWKLKAWRIITNLNYD